MKKNVILLFGLLLSGSLIAQKSGWASSINWKSNKQEFYFAIGPTQFLGDVGGSDDIGTTRSLRDMNMSMTKMGGGVGYRVRLNSRLATTTQLYFGMVGGSDTKTSESARNNRNITFRSPIVELSQRLEFILYANEQVGSRYLDAGRPKSDVLYLFSGISGFYFNPQTRYSGKWVNLRSLKTEGQGLPGGADPYSNFSVAIPFGIGFKMAINDFWRLGIEAVYNKTFTDYIDDVSTVYYDPEVLLKEVGEDAVFAANPSKTNPEWFFPGEKRGNPKDKDAYFYLNITVVKKIDPEASKGVKWNKM